MYMAMIKKMLSGTIGSIIRELMKGVSPHIRKLVVRLWLQIKDATDATPNEIDDCLTEGLKSILGIASKEIEEVTHEMEKEMADVFGETAKVPDGGRDD